MPAPSSAAEIIHAQALHYFGGAVQGIMYDPYAEEVHVGAREASIDYAMVRIAKLKDLMVYADLDSGPEWRDIKAMYLALRQSKTAILTNRINAGKGTPEDRAQLTLLRPKTEEGEN